MSGDKSPIKPKVFTPNSIQVQILKSFDNRNMLLALERKAFEQGMLSSRPDLRDVNFVYNPTNCQFTERIKGSANPTEEATPILDQEVIRKLNTDAQPHE